eukprot:5916554-Pyramimonas_sp.AAC.1
MKHEIGHLDNFGVHRRRREEEATSQPINAGWVHKKRGETGARSRVVAKGFKWAEVQDDVIVATPTPTGSRVIFALAVRMICTIRVGVFCVAFMRADSSGQG